MRCTMETKGTLLHSHQGRVFSRSTRNFNCWGLNLLGFKTFGVLCCLWIRPSLSSQISWLTQEDHLCRHQHITSKTSSVLDLHTEQSYMRNQRTIQLTNLGGNYHLLGFDVSSFQHKLTSVDKKSGTKGSIVVFVASFQLRFPVSEKKVFLVVGKFSSGG